MSVESLFRRLWLWCTFKIGYGPLVECPNPQCGTPTPLFAETCTNCELEITVQTLVMGSVLPIGFRFKEWAATSSVERKVHFQRAYLALSIFLMFASLAFAPEGESMYKCAIISTIYVAAIGLLVKFFFPQRLILAIARNTTSVVKIGLVANYFTLLVVMEDAIAVWWFKAVALAVVVLVTWAASWLLTVFLWPLSLEVRDMFLGTPYQPFNPMAFQGRRGTHDIG